MFLKQSTAYTFRMGPFLDDTDGKTAETGLTISQADVRLSKAGGNFAQKNESTSASHDEIGYYIVILDATDTATVGELLVAVHESGALPVFKTFQVVEEAIYDAIYGASADLVTKVDAIDTVVDSILVDTGTTLDGKIDTIDGIVDAILVDTGTTLDGKIDVIDGIVDSILVDTGTTLDGKIDTIDGIVDAILVDTGTTLPATLDTIDNFLDTEVAAILADTNELQGDWADGGRLDLLLDSVISKVDVVDGIVDDILVDTGTTLDGKLNTIDDFLDTEVAAILADTNELQGDWANGGRLDLLLDSAISKIDVVDGIVDNILIDTAEIGSAGAGLTAVPWNSSWDAEVQSECNDALVALGLDHLVSASVAGSDVVDNSIVAKLVSKESTADWDDFVNTTDSLQALRDRGDASWVTGGGSAPTVAEIRAEMDSNSTQLAAIVADTGELQTDWVNGGRLDVLLDSAISKIDVIDGIVDDILVDTGTTLPATLATIDGIVDDILVDTGTTLDGKIDAIDDFLDTEIAAILDDTNELQGDWVNGGRLDLLLDSVISKIDVVDGVVDSILLDTAEIGSAGAGLTAVPWNSAWDAEVQSECADALTAYDAPTKAELDTAHSTTDGLITTVDTVVDAIKVVTDAITTDGSGLSAIPWNSSWDTEVQSEVADGLAAYDSPTKAELDSAFTEIKGASWASGTDTLEAIRDRGDAAWTTGGGSPPTAAAIADAVWDEATSGHTTSGTFGEQVKTDIDAILVDTGTTLDGKIDVIDGIVDSILVDTGTTLNDKIDVIDGVVDSILVDTGTTLNDKIDVIDGVVDSILVDTGTTIPATIATIDTVVDAILVDTAVIGAAGAGLTAVPWNASWDAEVQSEVTDALNAYDPPTKAEMDAMWTTAQTESYASDGATATPAQLLYMILCAVSEFSISSTTITGKKVDGSTTAMTWTLDDATSPTSRTRAS